MYRVQHVVRMKFNSKLAFYSTISKNINNGSKYQLQKYKSKT